MGLMNLCYQYYRSAQGCSYDADTHIIKNTTHNNNNSKDNIYCLK